MIAILIKLSKTWLLSYYNKDQTYHVSSQLYRAGIEMSNISYFIKVKNLQITHCNKPEMLGIHQELQI